MRKPGWAKSLAYLVVDDLSGSRMVISTATKALEHQLVGRRPTPRALSPPYGETVPDTFCASLAQDLKVDSKLGAA